MGKPPWKRARKDAQATPVPNVPTATAAPSKPEVDPAKPQVDPSKPEADPSKPKRIRIPRPKAHKAERMVVVKCDALRLVEGAVREQAPGLKSLELMHTMRAGFAKFATPEQADAAVKRGGFSIAREPVVVQRAKGGDIFLAVNVKRILWVLLEAQFSGLVKLTWNPTMTYAIAQFRKYHEEKSAVQKGAVVLHGQAVQVSDSLYDATLLDVNAESLVLELLQQHYPGLETVQWSEDRQSADLQFRSPAEAEAAMAQQGGRVLGLAAKVVPLAEVGQPSQTRTPATPSQ